MTGELVGLSRLFRSGGGQTDEERDGVVRKYRRRRRRSQVREELSFGKSDVNTGRSMSAREESSLLSPVRQSRQQWPSK